MLIIGSVAAKYWLPDFRESADIDVWMHQNELESFYQVNKKDIKKFRPQKNPNKFSLIIGDHKLELGLYNESSPEYLIKQAQLHDRNIRLFNCNFKVASLKSLLLIKRSHIHYPIHWFKNIEDYTTIKSAVQSTYLGLGFEDDAILNKAFDMLCAATKKRFDQRHPNLNTTNENFFGRSQKYIQRKYIHDDIHKAVAFYDEPMYVKLKNDQSLARCDKSRWDKLKAVDKIKAIQEEAFVIALERYIIPTHPNFVSIEPTIAYDAFTRALCRIGTTLTSGWFRDFLIENWQDCKIMEVDYIQRFNERLKAGLINEYDARSKTSN